MFSIIITTYNRTDIALKTIEGLLDNLQDTDRQWILADDGSDEGHIDDLLWLIPDRETVHVTQAGRQGVGLSKNLALTKAFEISPYVLLLEDDWYLAEPLSLAPHIQIMEEHPEVGMIRFGFLGTMPHERFEAVYRDFGNFQAYWELVPRSAHYIYSGQVSLRHKRFYDFVGYHTIGLPAGEEEEEFCRRYADKSGVDLFLVSLLRADTIAPLVKVDPKLAAAVHNVYKTAFNELSYSNVPLILWPGQYGVTLNSGPFKNIGLDSSLNSVKPT